MNLITQEDKFALGIPGNPFPFAIGCMQVDSKTALASGMKGRGLRVLHSYGDALWAMGDKSIPDPSFRLERIYPQGQAPESDAATVSAAAVTAASPAPVAESAKVEAAKVASEKEEEASAKMAALSVGEKEKAPAAESAGGPPKVDIGTPNGMDAMLEYCFVKACVERLTDSELPVLIEAFYSNYLLPCAPEGCFLDIKKSNHKKLPKLLKIFEKKGLIVQKLVHKKACLLYFMLLFFHTHR